MVQMESGWADAQKTNFEVDGVLTNHDLSYSTCTWAFYKKGVWVRDGIQSIGGATQDANTRTYRVSTYNADSSDIKYACFEGKDPTDIHGTPCTSMVQFTGFPRAGSSR